MAEENAEVPKGDGETDADATATGKSKKKLLLIALGAVLVVAAGGGAAAYFLMTPSASESPQTSEEGSENTATEAADTADAEASAGDSKDGADEAKDTAAKSGGSDDKASTAEANGPPGVNFGNTFTFKTFHLNLGNPLENHYIRLEIAVEFKGGEEQRKEIEQRLPQLRDAVVSVTSRKTREFLLGPDGKDQLRREILIRMNRYMSQPLESVFLTDILIE